MALTLLVLSGSSCALTVAELLTNEETGLFPQEHLRLTCRAGPHTQATNAPDSILETLRVGVGIVLDDRLHGDTLLFVESADPWDPEDRDLYPKVLRPPLTASLLEDLRTLLAQRRIGVDTAEAVINLRLLGSDVVVERGLVKERLIARLDIVLQLESEVEGVFWAEGFLTIDTLTTWSALTEDYARAFDRAYCRTLGRIAAAVDSQEFREQLRRFASTPMEER